MTKSLPPRPSLEHLKHQATALLREGREHLPEALARLAEHLHRPQLSLETAGISATPARRGLKLADAQFVIAREYGFAHWAELKQHVELAELDAKNRGERIATLIECCLDGQLERAERLLGRFPDLAADDIFAAATLGDLASVQTLLERDPSLATKAGGPINAPPLVYACTSHYAAPKSSRESNMRAIADELLRCGADPDSRWLNPEFNHAPLSALYGACGVNGNVALAKILLDAGANPNDNESLYHSVEHDHSDCTVLLLERGATISGTNAVHHAVGLGHMAALKLFLKHGADVNERIGAQQMMTLFQWAIECNQDRDMLELLIEQGADLHARSIDGLTPYRRAVRCGHHAAIELLRHHGVVEELNPNESFLAACMAGDEALARRLLDATPSLVNMLPTFYQVHLFGAAWRGNVAAVRTMLAMGFDVASRNEHRATALHAAAWQGQVEIVQLLLMHHAPLDVKETEFDCTPLDWALHGSCNCHPHGGADAAATRDSAYATIVSDLLTAGSPPPIDRLVRLCRGRVEEALAEAGIVPNDQD